METEQKKAFEERLGLRFAHWNAPFWEGTQKGELRIQQCRDCKHKMYPPRVYCTRCLSANVEWIKCSGKGKLYAYSTIYEDPPPRVAKFLSPPYTLALVDLDEGVRMLTNIVECNPEDLKCDMEVEVVFHNIGEEVNLVWFRPKA